MFSFLALITGVVGRDLVTGSTAAAQVEVLKLRQEERDKSITASMLRIEEELQEIRRALP